MRIRDSIRALPETLLCIRRTLLTAACVLLAGGCVSTSGGPYGYLAYQQVQSGSVLTLNSSLTIPPGWASVKLQGGQVVKRPREMVPYCILLTSIVRDTSQTVEPDSFEIRRVRRSISPSSDFGALQPLRVAALDMGIGAITAAWQGGDGSPTQIFYKTAFDLRSPRQPNVMSLTCQWDQMTASGAAFARHLTVQEVRQTLGDLFTLTVAGQASRP